MIKIVISGILGKMGQVVKNELMKDNSLSLVGAFDRFLNDFVKDDLNKLPKTDVLIDFTNPSLLNNLLEYAIKNKVKLVLATTGYSDEDFMKIKEASKHIPIFYSANYSIGINQLINTISKIGNSINKDDELKIIDIHHKEKLDSPSGTAIYLANHLNDSLNYKRKIVYEGDNPLDINIKAFREGDVVGIHEIVISNKDETIYLKHEAHNKNIFAKGALLAAKFINKKDEGLYYMKDLYGDNNE